VFSHNDFPVIKDSLYALTLAPFGYYLFLLKKKEITAVTTAEELPEISVSDNWTNIFKNRAGERLESMILPQYLRRQRWFGGKARRITQVVITENIPIRENGSFAHLLFLKARYTEGPAETYVMPVSFISHGAGSETDDQFTTEGIVVKLDYDWLRIKADKILEESPHAIIARTFVDGQEGIVYDSFYNPGFRDIIFESISKKKRIKGTRGELFAYPGRMFRQLSGKRDLPLSSRVLKAEQSNTAVLYENVFFFKLYRKAAEGINPDMEIVRFLTERTKFTNIPPYAGAIEYRSADSEPGILGLLQGFVSNQGDTWTYMLDAVKQYFERVLAGEKGPKVLSETRESILDIDPSGIPQEFQDLIGGMYFEIARLLGVRTAELHMALSSVDDDPVFSPEPFSLLYQRSLYQSMRSLTRRVFQSFGKTVSRLPENIRDEAKQIYGLEKDILQCYEGILKKKISATKTRIHGDYHLGQVLYTGKDFIIIDFEGEPARPLSERKLKRSPLTDVAGMMRSFHYAVYAAFFKHVSIRQEDISQLEQWIEPWYECMNSVFLSAYLDTAGDSAFIPKDRKDIEILLNVFLLEKAVYELGYELNNRPDWLLIPFRGIQNILRAYIKQKETA
jgi:maltose alpha-D-glucosyltransferase/alpha-amylase